MPTLMEPSAKAASLPGRNKMAQKDASGDLFTRGMTSLSRPLCQAMDLALLSLALLVLVVAPYFSQYQLSLQSFLALRVSLRNLGIMLLCWIAWRALLSASGLYRFHSGLSWKALAGKITIAAAWCSMVAAAVFFFAHSGANRWVSAPWTRALWISVLQFFTLSFSFMALGRTGLILHHGCIRPRFRREKNLIVVGSGPRAHRVSQELLSHRGCNYVLLGFVDSAPQNIPEIADRVIGGLEQLEEILMRQVVDEVAIALPMKSMYAEIEETIAICERLGIQSKYSTDLFHTSITKRRFADTDHADHVILQMVHHDRRRHFKRAFDVAASLFLIVLLSPMLLFVAIAIKLTSKGPVLFRQQRYGLNKRTFWMYKFRTMVVNAEALQAQLEHLNETTGPVFKIRRDPRLIRIGAFLRSTSIDELPQLLNVLKGEMSLVGPRPLPARDVKLFSEAWLMRRFSVKPGLTCLWQAMGRSDTSFDRWIELDLNYIDHWSLSLDMKILAMTIPAVLKRRGAA
ncbi:MAG TPA: sugar transferase [Acidobacteriaceae bacterium]|nr:sugar transferase [Acidobacteriaceae bacterium]